MFMSEAMSLLSSLASSPVRHQSVWGGTVGAVPSGVFPATRRVFFCVSACEGRSCALPSLLQVCSRELGTSEWLTLLLRMARVAPLAVQRRTMRILRKLVRSVKPAGLSVVIPGDAGV